MKTFPTYRIPIFIGICRAVSHCNLHLFGKNPQSLHSELLQVIRESVNSEYEFELKQLYYQMYNRTWKDNKYESHHPSIVYTKQMGEATIDWEQTYLTRRTDSMIVVRFPFGAIGYFHPNDITNINPKWIQVTTEYGTGWITNILQPNIIQLPFGILYKGQSDLLNNNESLTQNNSWCVLM